MAGRAGFEPAAEFNPSTHLAGEPNRPLWHLPVRYSGGRGIRTHDGFHHTCFQDRRLKPLGHPSRGTLTRCPRILSYKAVPDKITGFKPSPLRQPFQTGCYTARRRIHSLPAALYGFPVRRYPHRSSPGSGRHPGWWRAGGQ